MVQLMKKIVFLKNWPLAIVMVVGLALGIAGTTVSAVAASTPTFVNWSSQGDFETNASTTGTPTTRLNIDTTTSLGDVKIGVTKDFVTTATITCVTASGKIYSTGVDRTTIAVTDAASKTLLRTISLPGRAAGVVYNSRNNKLYVGQYNDNKVSVINIATDTSYTLTSGTEGNGAYAAVYNPTNNKVYIANTGDQTVTILDGEYDYVLKTKPVVAGATTATFDAVADKVYFTSKANQFVTIIDGESDEVQDVGIDPPVNLLGGQTPGNVGLRVDAQLLGVTSADALHLSWKHDPLVTGQKIRFQVRTAADVISLGSVDYTGPDGPGTWYETLGGGATETTVDLNITFARWTEIQALLDSDGLSTPVLHSVKLSYESYPDLVITASLATQSSVTIGGAISITATVQNIGQGEAGSSNVGFYLVGNGTSYFLGNATVPNLDPGQIFPVSATFTVPTIPTGNYTLKACADNTNLVTETNDDNNCFSASTNISVCSVQPDLVITAVTPPSAGTGQVITVPVTAKNQGGGSLSGVYVGLYLCPTSTISTSCTSLWYGNFGGLTSGQPQTYSLSVTVPAVTSGTYYIGAMVDPGNTIQEYDETNNTRVENSTEITYGPDLVVTAVVPPPSAATGQLITVPITLQNQGIGSTLSAVVNVGLYLCPTSEINASCTSFGNSNFGGLTPGQSRTSNINLTVPAVTSNTYYIVAKADPTNIIMESNEDNNTRVENSTEITYGPDLVVTAVVPPPSAATGQLITVPITLQNQGIGSTLSAVVNVGLYLCPTSEINASCTSFGNSNFGGLTPGQSRTSNINLTVPAVTSNTYYIVAKADPTNIIMESNEDNNTYAQSININ